MSSISVSSSKEAKTTVTESLDSLSLNTLVSDTTNSKIPEAETKKLSEIQTIARQANPPTQSSHPSSTAPLENHLKRTSPFEFGSRYLSSTDDVFAWNAWDHVDPSQDSAFVSYANAQYTFQRENAASEFDRKRFNAEPEKWWDKFYGNNAANFFKDRKWLRQEFPVLGLATGVSHAELVRELAAEQGGLSTVDKGLPVINHEEDMPDGPWNTILEIGAGAGNTVFPLISHNRNDHLMIHAVDFSKKAVEVMKRSELYNTKHMIASQWDMASDQLPEGLSPGSVDVIILIFAFSALSPRQWKATLKNIWTLLRPGGEICFRDYGRGDLAQVRFKKGRLLGENFYVRGDGTRVYFFEEDELRRIWSGQLHQAIRDSLVEEEEAHDRSPGTKDADTQITIAFEIIKLATDRRLLVNRQKQLKMYRCWMQGRFRKPLDTQLS